jgi:hypothetical protein
MLRVFDIQTRKFTPFGPVPGTAIIDTGAGRRRILYATAKIDDDPGLRFERPVFQFDATGGDAPAYWTLATELPPDLWYNPTVNELAACLDKAEAKK